MSDEKLIKIEDPNLTIEEIGTILVGNIMYTEVRRQQGPESRYIRM